MYLGSPTTRLSICFMQQFIWRLDHTATYIKLLRQCPHIVNGLAKMRYHFSSSPSSSSASSSPNLHCWMQTSMYSCVLPAICELVTMYSVSCLVLIRRYPNSLSVWLSYLRVDFVFMTRSLIRALIWTAGISTGCHLTGIPSKLISTYPIAPG